MNDNSHLTPTFGINFCFQKHVKSIFYCIYEQILDYAIRCIKNDAQTKVRI